MATVMNQESAVSFVAGVALHLAIFRTGEWDTWSFRLLLGAIGLEGALSLLTYQQLHTGTLEALQNASCLVAAGIAGIFSSMVVYRAFFHRLSRFPGPLAARLSNFYMTTLSVSKGQIYQDVQRLHEEYGDYVRVGPTELSITDPKAFGQIHSGTSPCTRGPWYNVINPTISLQMVRDNKEHALRRKPWDRAFSSKGMEASMAETLV